MVLTSTLDKKIGDVVCLIGEWYKTEFNVFPLKGPANNIMMMSTFLGFTMIEGQKEQTRMVNGEVVKLKYPEVLTDN